MKVVLVGINSKFIHSNLAIRYLKNYTKDLNYECIIKEFSINDRIENIVKYIYEEKADLVGFSTYIWNVEYVERISKLLKLCDEKIKIFFGGPEVSFDGEEFLKNNSGEYLIKGEGEETYRELIEALINEDKEKLKSIKGIYIKENNNVKYCGDRELLNMDKIVFPYEEGEDLNNKIVYFEASRGCPFLCKYCLSSTTRKVRFLNFENVKEQLKFFIDKKVRLVKFVDRTFNCDSEFAKGIWKYLIENDNGITSFHFEISADLLKYDEIEILKGARNGLFQFEVGVQTTNNEILRNINRFVNFSSIEEKVKELMKLGNIKQHLDLIAGLPGEDLKSFEKSFNEVYSINPEEIQLGFLKILKGSPMREECEKWGMKYSPYPPYEIISTSHMSYDEMLELKRIEEMVDKYYNSQKFNNILRYFLECFKTPYEFYKNLSEFFEAKGYFKRNLSNADYYKVFIEFNKEFLKKDGLIIEEIVKFDYLKFNKKKWLPDFLVRQQDKEEGCKIKELYLKKTGKKLKEAHIEFFRINIIKYIYNKDVEKGKFFIVFDENYIWDTKDLI